MYTRRQFTAGLAAATVAPSDVLAQSHRHPNLFSVLGRSSLIGGRSWRFLGADGQEVDISQLQKDLSGHHATAYIGFSGCDQYCPITSTHMAALSEDAAKQDTKLKHIVIYAIPEHHGIAALRGIAIDWLEQAGLKPERPGRTRAESDTILLFTTANGKESGLNNDLVSRLSEALGNHTRHHAPTDHSAMVNLYAPGGNHLGRAMGTSGALTNELFKLLQPTARGR